MTALRQQTIHTIELKTLFFFIVFGFKIRYLLINELIAIRILNAKPVQNLPVQTTKKCQNSALKVNFMFPLPAEGT
ncbi:hypothetical protein [Segatella baroniae]|uniref:hypothetical protein n=1 Tax=Segatella baroniae TaxID=305719 RepID=UPI00138AFDE6|nr:hypothetical protein [Segatella baroniae]